MDEEEAAGLRISYWEMHFGVVLKDWLSWEDGNWSGDMEKIGAAL